MAVSTVAVQRVAAWRSQLMTWAGAQCGRPYVWGETDCASLVRAATRQMYGVDVFAGLVPEWRSQREAVRARRQVGGIGGALALAGAVPRVLAFVQAGDVWVRQTRAGAWHRGALGVALGGQQVLLAGPVSGVYIAGVAADAAAWAAYALPWVCAVRGVVAVGAESRSG